MKDLLKMCLPAMGVFVPMAGMGAPALSAQDVTALSLMEEAGARYSAVSSFCA